MPDIGLQHLNLANPRSNAAGMSSITGHDTPKLQHAPPACPGAFCALQGSPEGSIQLQLSLLAHEVKGQPELAASSEARLEAALGEAAQGQMYQTGGPDGPQWSNVKATLHIERATAAGSEVRFQAAVGEAAEGQMHHTGGAGAATSRPRWMLKVLQQLAQR